MRGLIGRGQCELRPGARDNTGHLGKLGAQALESNVAAARSRRNPLDGGEHLRGVGLTVAAGIFGEEPAPTFGREHGGANRLIIGLARRRQRRRGSNVRLGGIGHGGRHVRGCLPE
jgi:hypothetical protein